MAVPLGVTGGVAREKCPAQVVVPGGLVQVGQVAGIAVDGHANLCRRSLRAQLGHFSKEPVQKRLRVIHKLIKAAAWLKIALSAL